VVEKLPPYERPRMRSGSARGAALSGLQREKVSAAVTVAATIEDQLFGRSLNSFERAR
jgi:hypothetical protein